MNSKRISWSYAAVAGEQHKNNGNSCQDYTSCLIYDDNTAAVALSDGAGSKRFAKESARIIVEACLDYFKECLKSASFYSKSSEEFFSGLYNTVNSRFSDISENLSDYGGTLLFAAIIDSKIYIAHMGDGVIIGLSKEKSRVLSYPENGEYANITYFFPTDDTAHFRYQIIDVDKNFSLILASDGISEMLYSRKDNRIAGACFKFEEWNIQLSGEECSKMMESALSETFSQYSSDDKSVMIMSFHKQ